MLQKEDMMISKVRAKFYGAIENFPVTRSRLKSDADVVLNACFEQLIMKVQEK